MAFTPLTERQAELPLVLAGPILRRVSAVGKVIVNVLVVLKDARRVTIRVRERQGAGASGDVVLTGTVSTRKLGEHLHLALIRAEGSDGLEPGTVYNYDLDFDDNIGIDGQVPEGGAEGLESKGVFRTDSAPHDKRALGYPSTDSELRLPSFSLPPEDFTKLHLVQGSCRKPHNVAIDALAALDKLIGDSHETADARPHLLLLTGDQIYADDVGDALLFLIEDARKALCETAPDHAGLPDPAGLPDISAYPGPGARQELVNRYCAFTSTAAKSHLLSITDYLLIYLFVWSDCLWPEPDGADWPSYEDVYGTGPTTVDVSISEGHSEQRNTPKKAQFDDELRHLKEFRRTLPEVTRALANVPSYMVWDDHEVTDDWFLNRAWIHRVLKSDLGRHVLRNGYVAFGLFQAWGNGESPDLADFLDEVGAWADDGYKVDQAKALSHRIGLPHGPSEAEDFLDDLNQADEMALRKSDPTDSRPWIDNSIDWHFRIPFPGFDLVGLDVRTWRAFPSDKKPATGETGEDAIRDETVGLCALLGPEAIETQLPAPGNSKNLICLSAAPVLGIGTIETAQELIGRFPGTLWEIMGYAADPEAWGLQPRAFERLLARLVACGYRRALMLSGDVHYSFAARLRYWLDGSDVDAKFTGPAKALTCVQLTSSSLKNERGLQPSPFLHSLGYPLDDVVPDPTERLGWHHNEEKPKVIGSRRILPGKDYMDWREGGGDEPAMAELKDLYAKVFTASVVNSDPKPDWRYRIEYIPGTPEGRGDVIVAADQVTGAETAPPTGGAVPLAAYAKTAAGERKRIQRIRNGRHLLGNSNLAEVLFDETGGELQVTQRSYWRLEDFSLPLGPKADPASMAETRTDFTFEICGKKKKIPRPTIEGDPKPGTPDFLVCHEDDGE